MHAHTHTRTHTHTLSLPLSHTHTHTLSPSHTHTHQVRESNSRVVRWSDGTMSLYLGSEIFDIHRQPLQGEFSHLFVRQGGGERVRGWVVGRAQCRGPIGWYCGRVQCSKGHYHCTVVVLEPGVCLMSAWCLTGVCLVSDWCLTGVCLVCGSVVVPQ